MICSGPHRAGIALNKLELLSPSDRRAIERRANATLAELTLPELRRMMITTLIFVIVLVLFLWMVRTVIIASILGAIVASYARPVYLRLLRRLRYAALAATCTLILLIVPAMALAVYSYAQINEVAAYVSAHQTAIAAQIDTSLRQFWFGQRLDAAAIQKGVTAAAAFGNDWLARIRAAVANIAIAATIFLFTSFYVLVDADTIVAYIRSKIPPRYASLTHALESNMRGVLYGAIYSTFLTQTVKSLIIFLMNIAFHVPLSAVLAILSFVIGFFPIVGSWSVYVPVAVWLLVFRDSPTQAVAMVTIGFVVNTIYISTIMRPRIAAERSRVLNFYWMLVGLVTGVYTFGLVGILLGPLLIGSLKAILDTITSQPGWRWSETGGDAGRVDASEVMP